MITRQEKQLNDKELPRIEDLSIHTYPFKELTFQSHVHPRYVIYETGRKLRNGLSPEDFAEYERLYPEIVNRILHIFDAWCQPVPEGAEDEPPFRPSTPQPPDIADEGSDWMSSRHTPRGRLPSIFLNTKYLLRRRRPGFRGWTKEELAADVDSQSSLLGEEPPNVKRSPSPPYDLGEPGAPLTRQAVQQLGTDVKPGRWTDEQVKEWYRKCIPCDHAGPSKRRRSQSF